MVKLLAGASTLGITFVLFGINRGFDISDEGLYVLLADPHQPNVAGIFNYDLFFKLLFRTTGFSFSMVELRIFRLLSYFAAAWALAGFWKNIRNEVNIRAEVLWIAFLGIIVGYAFLPPTLSYNSLTVVLTCFWLNFVSRDKSAITYLFLTGLLLALLVYIKITLALLIIPITFLILIFWKKVKPLKTFGVLLPIILLELLFWMVLDQNAMTRLVEGIPLNSQRPGYQLGLMVKSIAVGGLWIASAGTLFFMLGLLKRKTNPLFLLALPIVVVGILAVLYFTHITEEWNHLILIFSAGIFGFYIGRHELPLGGPKIWIGILLLLPFLLHFGSNVYWLRIGIHYWVFWIIAFMLCFENIKNRLAPLMACVSVFLVFNGIWWHPFGQDQPLWKEKIPWNVNKKEVLNLDPDLVHISGRLKVILEETQRTQLLAAYRIPGLIWLSGIQNPYSPGIWDKSQLQTFYETKPQEMIYNNLESLPNSWTFSNHRELGIFQGDTLLLLWD